MAEGRSTLQQSFTVNQNAGYSTVGDLILNIEKRLEVVDFLPNVSNAQALISYLNSSKLSVDNNLSIIDQSSFLNGNRVPTISEYTIESDTLTITASAEDVLITDVFVTATNTINNVPLFYKHQIVSGHFDPDNHTIVDVKVLDEDLEQINVSEYSLDSTNGIFYNNLESEYSSVDDSFLAYYLQYTIKESTTSIRTYTVLLDNGSVYRLATAADLDGSGSLLTTAKVYTISEPDLNGNYTFAFPTSGTYAYRYPNSTRLKILSPVANTSEDPWYVRIAKGIFTQSVGGISYKYHIAEIDTQSFTPFAPYRYSQNERAVYLNKNLLKLMYSNVYQDTSQDMYLTLHIYNSNDELLYAPTTSSALHGNYVGSSDTITYSSIDDGGYYGIRSVDSRTGLVDVQGIELKESWKIYGFYYYEHDDLLVTDINFNPIYNTDLLDKTVVFFVLPPASGSIDVVTQTIFYLVVNDAGRVTSSNWSGFSAFDTELQTVGGNYLFYGTLPTWFVTKYGSGAGTNFTSTYATEGSGYYFVLGEVQVVARNDTYSVDTIDVRQEGGYLKSTSSYFTEHGDASVNGALYPSTGCFYVEIPDSVLSGAGGVFSQKQVRKVVERHMAYGMYPVVRSYGIDPAILTVVSDDGSATITWSHADSDVYYNIYYGTDRDSEFTLANGTPQQENASSNSYTINGLTNGLTYYVYVIGGRYESGTWRGSVKQVIGNNNKGAVSSESLFFTRFVAGAAHVSNVLSQSFTVV